MIKVCKSQIVVAQVVQTILTYLTVEWVFIRGSLIQLFWHFQAFILLARQPSQQIELNGAERYESHWLNEKHPRVLVPIARLISEQILRSVFLTELPWLGLCAAISTRGLHNVDKLYFWCYISCPLWGLLFRKFSVYSSSPTVPEPSPTPNTHLTTYSQLDIAVPNTAWHCTSCDVNIMLHHRTCNAGDEATRSAAHVYTSNLPLW